MTIKVLACTGGITCIWILKRPEKEYQQKMRINPNALLEATQFMTELVKTEMSSTTS